MNNLFETRGCRIDNLDRRISGHDLEQIREDLAILKERFPDDADLFDHWNPNEISTAREALKL